MLAENGRPMAARIHMDQLFVDHSARHALGNRDYFYLPAAGECAPFPLLFGEDNAQ